MERIKLNIQKFANVNNVEVEFVANVEKVQNNIKKLTATIDELKTSLQASNIMYGNNSKSLEVLQQRNQILNETYSAQKKLVKNLETALKSQSNQSEEDAKKKEKLANQINKVGNAMTLTQARIDKNNQKIKEQTEVTEEATEETYNYKNAISELGEAFSGLNLSYIIGQFKRFATTLYSDFITKSIDTSEELNLFNVVFDNMQENGKKTFSELGKQATSFQNRLNEAFGTNIKETMRYQGLFQAMGESAGLEDTIANLMSENMTKLAYDLASLYNTTETRAAESLRAGVYAGQTKPLRNYGIDVTQTSFKPIMEELGLEKSVNELTQAEKEILRYIATLNQAKNAMGDFANTIESPANQLKILRQQFYEMQAAIGNLFVGAFARILPYVNAIIMVIKEVARAIASFFGIDIQDYNSGLAYYEEDLEDYSDAIGGIGDSADDAAGSIKALKRQVLGFDQINNLTSPTPSSGGSGGGGGAGGGVLGGIDDKLLAALKGYENGMDKVRMKANEIRDKMMEILGFTRNINGEWEWGGFSKLVKNFTKWFSDLDFKGKVLVVTGMATAFTTLFNIIKGFGKLTGVTSLFKTIGKVGGKLLPTLGTSTAAAGTATASGSAAAGTATTAGAGSALATTGAVAAGIAVTVAEIVGANKAIDQLFDTFDKFSRGEKFKFDWVDKLSASFLLIAAQTSPLVAGFELAKISFELFSEAIKPIHADDILDLAGVSDKTKETLGQVLKDFEDFTKDLNLIQILNKKAMDENGGVLGTIITQENVDELKRLFNDATLVTVSSLEKQKNETISNVTSMKDQLGDQYEDIVKSISESYDKQIEETNAANEDINKILQTALEERGYLTQEEMDKINEIRAGAQDNAITMLSDSEAEQLAIRQMMKDKAVELNATQAAEIIQKSAETRDKIMQDAEEQYQSVLKEAEKLKAAKLITEEQYEAMKDAAEDAYVDTVASAIKQHEEVYNEFAKQNEDIAKYIDEDTGQIIPKWKAYLNSFKSWWDDLWVTTSANFMNKVIPSFYNAGEELAKSVQEGIDNEPDPNVDITTDPYDEIQANLNNEISRVGGQIPVGVNLPSSWSIQSTLSSILSGVSGGLNLIFSRKAEGGIFTNGHWQPIQAYANGGMPSSGQLFAAREDGPELVGKIGRHTAVMNNNQIVDSVKAGVYEAVSAAMSQGGMGSVQIDLHTDEGVVVDRINRITRQTGNCPIEI